MFMGIAAIICMLGYSGMDDDTPFNATTTVDSPDTDSEDKADAKGKTETATDWKRPIKTAAEARQALLAQNKSLRLFHPVEAKQWTVRQTTFADVHKTIDHTFRNDRFPKGIRYGTIGDLQKKGKCWHVRERRVAGPFSIHTIAILDAQSGKVVFVWSPPPL